MLHLNFQITKKIPDELKFLFRKIKIILDRELNVEG